MEEKILEAIRESLPQKEVGIIKDVFEEAVKLRKMEKEYINYQEQNEKVLKNKDEEIQRLTERNSILVNNSIQVEKQRETNESYEKELFKRECLVNSAIASAESAAYKLCLETVFKPSTVRKTYQSHIPITSYDYNNGNPNGSYIQTNDVEETKIDT